MRWIASLGLVVGCGSVGGSDKHDAAIDTKLFSDAPTDGATCAANPSGLGGRWRADMSPADELGHYGATGVSAINYVPGAHGYGFLISGVNGLTIDDGDMLWPTDSFSLEAWVKTSGAGVVMEKYQCANFCPSTISTGLWELSIGATGNPTFGLRTDASQVVTDVTDTLHDVADNNWHHLVGVRDSIAGTGAIYVDGALGVSTTLPTDQLGPMTNADAETDPITIGMAIQGGSNTHVGFLTGTIDEISYYNAALTSDQIHAIYAAPDGECIEH